MKSIPAKDRVLRKVRVDRNGCWIYTGALTSLGYGRTSTGSLTDGTRRGAFAHRVMYEAFTGPIPDGFDLDHLCRNPSCCNPGHLEAVTHRENLLRGNTFAASNAAKTHCANGHEFADRNVGRDKKTGSRVCRACRAAQQRRRRAALQEVSSASAEPTSMSA